MRIFALQVLRVIPKYVWKRWTKPCPHTNQCVVTVTVAVSHPIVIVLMKNTLCITFTMYKEIFCPSHKPIKVFPFCVRSFGSSHCRDWKRCKSDGSQLYDIAIAIGLSQMALEIVVVKMDDNLDVVAK